MSTTTETAAEVTARPVSATPRIWIADLGAYTAGYLHGEWVDVTAKTTAEDLAAAARAILATSPVPGAEEHAIFDYDEFGDARIEEYESFETVVELAHAMIEHGPAYTSYLNNVGQDYATAGGFEESYVGHYDDAEEYAAELIEESGMLAGVPETVASYFDLAAYTRDLQYGGDITAIRRPDGDGVDIFNNY